jgi:D-alanyl-D-alanine carboxypeptidase (penicillin-binding protein 5/6)
MESYTAYANKMVKRLGMSQTTVSDASGFSPLTVSTAGDLVKLGDAALDHPVLAEIIGQKQATFPNYGTIQNVNSLIGQVGIRGIKTGNTEEAGGCYLAAADVQIGGQKVTVITAIMGATTRPQAMKDSVPIIQSAVSQFQNVQVVKAGQSVGTVSTAWGARSDIVAGKGISVLTWNGTALSPRVAAKPIGGPRPANTEVGTLNLVHNKTTTSSKLYTRTAIAGPSVAWRLTHPF